VVRPRPARKGRGPRSGSVRRGILFSVLLHLGLAALVALASWQREKPPEPLPPPAYEVAFEAGAPDRPAEEESAAAPDSAPILAEAVPEEPPAPPVVAEEPSPPETTAQALPEEPAPPPPSPEEARTAEADPLPPADEVLPTPPPAPAPPQREAALTAPPRPLRPAPPERLPGIYVPNARLNPLPPQPEPPRRGLDLSPPSAMRQPGRESPDAQLSVRGAQIGPDWRNAFRRWMDEHGRYPTNAAVVGEQGTTRIELIVEPDGRVRSGKLVRRSGSVWLDAGTVSLFRNAVLPPFPPGADPAGVTIDLTINYVLVR
jgi:TonB family protein